MTTDTSRDGNQLLMWDATGRQDVICKDTDFVYYHIRSDDNDEKLLRNKRTMSHGCRMALTFVLLMLQASKPNKHGWYFVKANDIRDLLSGNTSSRKINGQDVYEFFQELQTICFKFNIANTNFRSGVWEAILLDNIARIHPKNIDKIENFDSVEVTNSSTSTNIDEESRSHYIGFTINDKIRAVFFRKDKIYARVKISLIPWLSKRKYAYDMYEFLVDILCRKDYLPKNPEGNPVDKDGNLVWYRFEFLRNNVFHLHEDQYTSTGLFVSQIIKKSIECINTETNIVVEYFVVREGRKSAGVRFVVREKENWVPKNIDDIKRIMSNLSPWVNMRTLKNKIIVDDADGIEYEKIIEEILSKYPALSKKLLMEIYEERDAIALKEIFVYSQAELAKKIKKDGEKSINDETAYVAAFFRKRLGAHTASERDVIKKGLEAKQRRENVKQDNELKKNLFVEWQTAVDRALQKKKGSLSGEELIIHQETFVNYLLEDKEGLVSILSETIFPNYIDGSEDKQTFLDSLESVEKKFRIHRFDDKTVNQYFRTYEKATWLPPHLYTEESHLEYWKKNNS